MPLPLQSPIEVLVAVGVFVFGACIGSFLNVVIYRLPLGKSINNPKRSYCPHCNATIRARHNIPIIGWLMLGGRCADCGARIALRYPVVEFLTAALVLAVWLFVTPANPWLAAPYFVFVAILVAATFIDFDHMIIPHELTWGGVAAGVLCSLIFPQLMGKASHLEGGIWSLIAAAGGYSLLWIVVHLGKFAFGREHVAFDAPQNFEWKNVSGDDSELQLGDDTIRWSDTFFREGDCLELACDRVEIESRLFEGVKLRVFEKRVEVENASYPLGILKRFSGVCREATIPREAMGFGDVHFLAAIGAFLGWQAVLFSVAAASIVGSVVGLAMLPLQRRTHSIKLPFGPYLSVGALLWLFFGPALTAWYFGLFRS